MTDRWDLGISQGLKRELVLHRGATAMTIAIETPSFCFQHGTFGGCQEHTIHHAVVVPNELVAHLAEALTKEATS